MKNRHLAAISVARRNTMEKITCQRYILAAILLGTVAISSAHAQIPASISTPDKVETRLGTLNFKDGVPDNATAQKLFDEIDYVHAVEAFINGYAAVNQLAMLKGFRAAGVNDNDVLVTSGLMDSKSLFLTANADTYYFWSLSGPDQGAARGRDSAGQAGHHSTTCGGTGSAISDFRGPTADKAESTCCCHPDTTGTCPRAATTCASPERHQVAFLGRAFLAEQRSQTRG